MTSYIFSGAQYKMKMRDSCSKLKDSRTGKADVTPRSGPMPSKVACAACQGCWSNPGGWK